MQKKNSNKTNRLLLFQTEQQIFDKIIKNVNFRPKLWKYVGDEILFFQEVNKTSDILESVIKASDILKEICDCLHMKGNYQKENIFNNNDIFQLSVKATIWMAVIDGKNNIITNLPGIDDRIDFLGRDIDIGFRIAKYVSRSKIVISANLAYLLSNSYINKNLRIIDYKELKGVWLEKRYPIIWYLRDNTIDNIPLSFFYDEKYDSDISDIICKILNECKTDNKLEKNKIVISSLEEMFQYLGIWEVVYNILCKP